MLVQIKDAPGYFKDTDTGAIINTDDDGYKSFIAQREASKRSRDLCKRMNDVEGELRDIKTLLLQIVHRNN